MFIIFIWYIFFFLYIHICVYISCWRVYFFSNFFGVWKHFCEIFQHQQKYMKQKIANLSPETLPLGLDHPNLDACQLPSDFFDGSATWRCGWNWQIWHLNELFFSQNLRESKDWTTFFMPKKLHQQRSENTIVSLPLTCQLRSEVGKIVRKVELLPRRLRCRHLQ